MVAVAAKFEVRFPITQAVNEGLATAIFEKLLVSSNIAV